MAGDIDGSRSIRIGLRAGREESRYSKNGFNAGFSCLSALGLSQRDQARILI